MNQVVESNGEFTRNIKHIGKRKLEKEGRLQTVIMASDRVMQLLQEKQREEVE